MNDEGSRATPDAVANEYVSLCRAGRFDEAMTQPFSTAVVRLEPLETVITKMEVNTVEDGRVVQNEVFYNANPASRAVRHLNPDELFRNPAFSQAVVVARSTKTIYVGRQNGVDAEGKVVAADLAGQSRQALQNLATILDGEGATLTDVVRWTIAVVEGHLVQDGYDAFQELWDPAAPPPAITVLVVSGLANPEFLVEIDAIAVT